MKEQLSLVEKILSEENCGKGMYWCNTNKECKPLPTGFDVPGQKIKPTEVGIGKPVEGSCSKTKKGKDCPVHGMDECPMSVDEACWKGYKKKGMKTMFGKKYPNCVKVENTEIEESLRDWFGKSKSDDGKPGWVQSDGSPCANEPGETKTPKCFSRDKLSSMTKGEIASAVRRKREKDPGQQSKSGAASPTYVSTDSPTKKMKEEFFKENHKAIAAGREKDEEGYMANTEMDTIDSAVKKLRKIIKKGDSQLPAWVQSKITKAADYIDAAADYLDSNEMSEESDVKGKGSGTKDACYTKVKSRYDVWPSAYASGALVKCRKVGAKNWGNKSKNEEIVYEGDYWHPDPEMDRKLGGPGPNQRAREDHPQPKSDPKKLRKGESYMDWNKRQRGLNNSYEPDGELIDESTRLQAETGNILAVILNWRGKTYSIRMFFPQTGMPSRKDVTTEIQKIYPGSQVLQYKVSTIEPGMPLIQVVNSKSKNYLLNSKTIGEEVEIEEDWQKENRKDKTDGLSQKAVNAYRRENPGSNLQTAVTEKKPTGKRASRRKNFCSRMSGMKSKLTSAKTARDPDSRINKALRRWNCN